MCGRQLRQLLSRIRLANSCVHSVSFFQGNLTICHKPSRLFGGLFGHQPRTAYVIIGLTLHPATLCRPDFSQSLMSAAAASKSAVPAAASGPTSLARLSAPAVRAPRTAFPGLSATGSFATTSRLATNTAQGASSTGLHSSGAPQSSASGPLGAAAMYSMDAAREQGHLQQPNLARASMPVQNRQGSSQLPPSGAPAKSGKSKGVMASMLGSVKKAVGIKSRTRDLQR